MAEPRSIDGVLLQWGDRLFYPPNRIVRPREQPRLRPPSNGDRAAWLRERIEAAAVRRAPQVMVKVTGGGRGMKAIAAHLRYISKNGRLEIEDDEGRRSRGKDALREIADEWRYGGSLIPDVSDRREAFNIMLSMPRGSAQPSTIERAAREFAKAELGDHKYVMVVHDHQANPHVHLSVRAESKAGRRLNPRKADLQRWRETFAEKLRELGIDAEATRQATRGIARNYPNLWQEKARAEGRLRIARPSRKAGAAAERSRAASAAAWAGIAETLARSPDPRDRALAGNCRVTANQCREAATRGAEEFSRRSHTQEQPSASRRVDRPDLTR
jgi:hypothetical protein